MATYYVGPGGNDSNNGTSYALRKLTLNAVEDLPVAANDTVYVAPGVYRETLTVDVSGSSGQPITYIGDVSGEHTDGVGGIVRLTPSTVDTTVPAQRAISASTKGYRTFRGFWISAVGSEGIALLNASSNWIIEDCMFSDIVTSSPIYIDSTASNNTIRRCIFPYSSRNKIVFTHSADVNNTGHVVENCIFGGNSTAIISTNVGGITVRNCLFLNCSIGVRVASALDTGQTVTVQNCIFAGGTTGVQATVTGELVEDYNTFFDIAARANVSTGSNSNTYQPLFVPPILLDGFVMPWNPYALSEWSQIRRLAGTAMASDDLFGITRPTTDSKKSWGAVQYDDKARETTTKRTGTASIKLADAGRHQMFVPTSNVSTTFSVYVQWEADYAGTKPQLVVKQPGQSDTTDTATGSSGSWEELSITLTPAASPGYCVVELVSSNTATSGNYDTFFDDLTVT